MYQSDRILSLLAERKSGFSLPQPFYNDEEIFRADLETIFYRNWLFAGHTCELAKAGDYFTWRVGNCEAIVVRGADGKIRAFHNSCRHRGSRICSATKGSAPKLVCPYHQWTYELDGRLLFARDMGPDFDAKAFGLRPVHCETMGGYIYVCFADVAPDFSEYRRIAEPYVLPHDLENAKIAHESSIIEKGNWKLVWENNRECYHCSGSHPALCRTYPDAPGMVGSRMPEPGSAAYTHWQRCEAAGLPSSFNMGGEGTFRVMRIPLLREAESYTMSGKPAVTRQLGAITERKIGAMVMFNYPTTWNHLLGDHAVTFRVTPIGPQETMVTTKWLVHKDAVEGRDYNLSDLTAVWTATNDEDRMLVEQNQLGINSPAYTPGPYAPDQEAGVDQFVDWYCRTLSGRVSGSGHKIAAE